jgi:two-component system sensor histidine kinase KdpD
MALAYLLIVLGGSARNGRWLGLVLAVACFLAFNFFLLPPYYTLSIEDPLDWWVLIAFLATGMVAAQLFHQAQRALGVAENRAGEVERLAALGAESLSVPRASDAVVAVARMIRNELPVRAVEVVVFDQASGEATVVARAGMAAGETPAPGAGPPPIGRDGDGRAAIPDAVRQGRVVLVGEDGQGREGLPGADLASLLAGAAGSTTVLVPLAAGDRPLGALALHDPGGVRLDRARGAFADTLVYYAALAVERLRLAAQAEHVEALQEADRLKDALLASVSHDLRTPLTTIRALASELRAGGDERSVVIEQEADRLNRLVSDLLDMSRIRGGVLPLEPQVIAAEDLVGAMLQRMAGVAGADRIDVQLPPGGALPLGRFDFVQALRALGNLVENALHHSPVGARVTVEVSEEGDELVFRVLDRGPGVPEADRERIFEPFYGTGSENGREGTGLGLAIARSVSEAQGGRVGHHPRPGGGSVFELRLPRETLEAL